MAKLKIVCRIALYEDFKKRWLNKSVDYDKAYGPQCVDLAKQYADEIYDEKIGNFWGSAYKGFLNWSKTFDTTKWKQVVYKNWEIPIAWDIIFWKPTKSNSYGHVAIAWNWSTITKLILLEQNYVLESSANFGKWTGPAAITERTRDYKDFAGSWRYIW